MTFEQIRDRLESVPEILTLSQGVRNRIVEVTADSVTLVSDRTGRRRTIPFTDILSENATANGCIVRAIRDFLGLQFATA